MEELRYQVDLLTAMNQKLSKSEKMYRMVCDMSSCAYLYYSYENDQVEILGNWSLFFPFEIQKMDEIGRICDYVEEADAGRLLHVIQSDVMLESQHHCECKIRGKKQWFECELSVSLNEQGEPLDKAIKFRDITRFKLQNDELSYLAYYDTLTGLYNRNHFVGKLSEWIRQAEQENSVVSVLFIDIDDFRKINDGMGLIVGDELVQVFGQYLGEFMSDHIIVSHINSDIYCMAIYDPCGNRSVERINQEIRQRLEKPFILTGKKELHISVGIGVAEYPESAKDALELINNAEIVMFKAKAAGKNGIQYFDAPIINDFLHTIQIENKLKDAVLYNQFTLYFQPQFYIESGKLRGVEALIRWKDENGKMISPGEFIPIAEKNGSIVTIGSWVIGEALRIYASWRDKYDVNLIMSINISAIQYKRTDFVSNMIGLLEKYHVNPNEIELEITESILIEDFSEVVTKMKMLRDYGIRVSLDDFGTGYSSLSYLKELPIDTLKIDKSFIDTVITDDSTRIITESIVSMVKKLGFETVAEGVETEEQYEYLKNIHCDNIQGFYLGKPMPKEEIEEILIRQL